MTNGTGFGLKMDFSYILVEPLWIFENTTSDIDVNGEYLSTRVAILGSHGNKSIF